MQSKNLFILLALFLVEASLCSAKSFPAGDFTYEIEKLYSYELLHHEFEFEITNNLNKQVFVNPEFVFTDLNFDPSLVSNAKLFVWQSGAWVEYQQVESTIDKKDKKDKKNKHIQLAFDKNEKKLLKLVFDTPIVYLPGVGWGASGEWIANFSGAILDPTFNGVYTNRYHATHWNNGALRYNDYVEISLTALNISRNLSAGTDFCIVADGSAFLNWSYKYSNSTDVIIYALPVTNITANHSIDFFSGSSQACTGANSSFIDYAVDFETIQGFNVANADGKGELGACSDANYCTVSGSSVRGTQGLRLYTLAAGTFVSITQLHNTTLAAGWVSFYEGRGPNIGTDTANTYFTNTAAGSEFFSFSDAASTGILTWYDAGATVSGVVSGSTLPAWVAVNALLNTTAGTVTQGTAQNRSGVTGNFTGVQRNADTNLSQGLFYCTEIATGYGCAWDNLIISTVPLVQSINYTTVTVTANITNFLLVVPYDEDTKAQILNATMIATISWNGGQYSSNATGAALLVDLSNVNSSAAPYTLQIYAASTGYTQRTYSYYFANWSSLNTTINAYLTTSATLVHVTVYDSGNNPYANGSLIIQRFYPSTNEFIEIQRDQLDGSGSLTTPLTVNTVFYKFIVMNPTLTQIMFTQASDIIYCPTTPCTVTLRFPPEIYGKTTYIYQGLVYSHSFDNVTNISTLTAVDTSGYVQTWYYNVSRITLSNTTTICSVSNTSSSATLYCYLGNTANNTYTWSASFGASPPISFANGVLDFVVSGAASALAVISSLLPLVGFLIFLAFTFAGLFKPSIAPLTNTAGIGFAWLFGTLAMSWLSVITIAALGFILSYRLSKLGA